MPKTEHPRELLRFGDFELDPVTGELSTAGSSLRLQPQPLKVLLALLRSPGELVAREQLKRELMPEGQFGDADHAINLAVTKLRSALQDSSDKPHYIDTLPRRGYRFIAKLKEPGATSLETDAADKLDPVQSRYWLLAFVVALLITALTATLVISRRSVDPPSERYPVVVGAFRNGSGVADLDRTLRNVVSADLQHSSLVSLLSDEKIASMLPLMMKPGNTVLVPEVARDVCRRSAGVLVVDGAVTTLGEQYVLDLKASNCATGDLVFQKQATAATQEHVAETMTVLAKDLSKALVSELPPVKQRAPPVESVTTDSYDALRAYTLGYSIIGRSRDESAAVPVLEHAISLSPGFAMAYLQLGTVYRSMGQNTRAEEMIAKAHDLSQHVSQRESIQIEAAYERVVTGNLDAARKKYRLLTVIAPSDATALVALGEIHVTLGECEKATSELQKALSIAPRDATVYAAMVEAELCRNNLNRVKLLAHEASKLGIDNPRTHIALYRVGFLENDDQSMSRESEYLNSLPEWSATMLCLQAMTDARRGHLENALRMVRKASDTALLENQLDTAASCYAAAAEWESLVGNFREARAQAHAALSFARSREVKAKTAIALAVSGEFGLAERQAQTFERAYPADTLVHTSYVPAIRGTLAMKNSDYDRAIEALPRNPFCKLSDITAVYMRARTYSDMGDATAAAEDFQRILQCPGVVANDPIGALAQIELTRIQTRLGSRGQPAH